jgi:ketosteroid isomerase-like protein
MSQENVERVRTRLDAYNRGDFDALVETNHSEIEVVPPGGQSAIKGTARVRTWTEPDAFESQAVEPLDFRAVGNTVLVHARTRIRGTRSGIETDFLVWLVWTFDDAGLTTRIEIYPHHQEAEALEAAGLHA